MSTSHPDHEYLGTVSAVPAMSPAEIVQTYYGAGRLSQADMDNLREHGVSNAAMVEPDTLTRGCIEVLPNGRFEFTTSENGGVEAILLLCRDAFGDAIDIAA